MNQARIMAYTIMGVQFGSNVVVRPGVLMKGCKNISIGDDVFIGEQTTLVAYGGKIEIGKDVLIADNVYVSTRNHRFRDAGHSIRSQGYKEANVLIEEDVWLAHSSVVLAGSKISKGCVIGAAQIAPKLTEEYEIFTPAGVYKRESK